MEPEVWGSDLYALQMLTPAGAHQSLSISWAKTASWFLTMSTSTATRGTGVGVGRAVGWGWPLATGGSVGVGLADRLGSGVTSTSGSMIEKFRSILSRCV